MADPNLLPISAADKVLDFAERSGVARDRLLAAPGLTDSPAIAYDALCDLYEAAARATGDAAFGLHVGEQSAARHYGLLGYVAANRETLGDALASLVELQRVWTDAVGIEVRRSRGAVAIGYRHRGRIAPERRRQECEQMLAAILGFVRDALAAPVRPIEVRFEHRPPPDRSEYDRLFQAPVLFDAPATEIVFDAELLRAPIAEADPVLGALVRDQAEAALAARADTESLAERIRRDLRARLLEGAPASLADAAARAGLGARSLQRRLAAHGLAFRDLAEQARLDCARTLLLDPRLGLAEIAHRLGYSQPSAFHRAFRRAFGTTPRQFRLAARSGAQA